MNNATLIDSLNKRRTYLTKLISAKSVALAGPLPEGRLRCSMNKGAKEYYLINKSKDTNGKYIRKEDMNIASSIAQRDYDEAILKAATSELHAIDRLLAKYDPVSVDSFYEMLSPLRQELVNPISLPDDQFAQIWQNTPYDKPAIPKDIPEFYTAKGEQVRSKSEILIADSLGRENIPYLYETPLYLKGFGLIHPDFKILNVRLRKVFYWEHLGKLGDLDYCRKNLPRINSYILNGIIPGDRLILTFESDNIPLDTRVVNALIHQYLL